MSKPLPTFLVPIAGCPPVAITIEDARLRPLVHIKDVPPGPMTSFEACQLGLALCEAAKVAGQLAARRERG